MKTKRLVIKWAITAVLVTGMLFPTLAISEVMAAEKPIILKVAHVNLPPTHPLTRSSKHFVDEVKKNSNGSVEPKLFFDTIAKGQDVLPATSDGIADAFCILSAFLTPKLKDLDAVGYIGAYPPTKFYPEVSEAIRPTMEKIFVNKNIKYLGCYYVAGSVIYASRVKHHAGVDSFKGQKIRTVGRNGFKAIKLLGGTPTHMLAGELYTSLQRGVIDGLISNMTIIYGFKLQEVAPYLTEFPNLIGSVVILGMNLDRFNSLKKEQQDVVVAAAKSAEKFCFDETRKMEAILREKLKKSSKYVIATPEQVRAYLTKTDPLKEEIRSEIGPLGKELMTKCEALFDK